MTADKPETPAQPGRRRVSVPLTDETIQKIADVLPNLRAYAAARGEPQTGEGDVIDLAVSVLHNMVCGEAEILAKEIRDQSESGEIIDLHEAIRERERGVTEH